ncbi:phage tail tape measure protein [Viridibacillus arvi]|uniref:phage tail tape measure protein n=1 Tax=Viridibacillus arvi TaxID=263475 RepID=UPI0034CF006E
MAGNNKIGIEVQVQFPTVAELQRQLADKWKSVKNGFEGKINIGVDGHSLNTVKRQIQDALNGKEFQIKLDSKMAMNEIATVQKGLKTLDEKISKVREIKIKFDVSDMNKSMKEIIDNNQKIENSVNNASKKAKGQNAVLEEQLGIYDKIVRKYKLLDGKKVTTQIKTTHVGDDGSKVVRTTNSKGTTEERTNDVLGKRKDLLREVQNSMKTIFKLEMDQRDASVDHSKIIDKQLQREKQLLGTLKNQYSQKYKTYALQEDSSKELANQQKIAREIRDQLDFEKMLTQQQKEQAKDVQKFVALEQKIHSLKLKQINALDSEKEALNEQVRHYEKIKGKIQERLTGENKMTAEQEEQISNLKTINGLEQSRATEKKKQQEIDARTAQEQKEANRQIMANLNEIHRMKMRIAQIEQRRNSGGTFGDLEKAELETLQKQLAYRKRNATEDIRMLAQQGLITSEMREQLKAQQKINAHEESRVRQVARVNAEQDRVKATLSDQEKQFKNLLQIETKIVQLQRDLVFAGMREKDVIQKAVAEERKKANEMAKELQKAGALTTARQKEIEAIKKATAEQGKLNASRQKARERDRSFDDTGGLIDPYSTLANGQQAYRAILEPMKEIDESFYRVAKVADATDEVLQNFKDTSYDVGTSLGTSASDYMKAVEIWVTAGKTFQESQELGQISQIGSFVGNISPEDMVKYMAVPLNAYRDAGLEAEDVINSMNEVANNNAIEMNDLGKAYIRSAGSARDAGMSFSELTGMITGAQEATRKGGERIGTGIKSMAINISQIYGQLSAGNKKKYDFFKDTLGIDFADKNGDMKSMTKIFDELSVKWKTMSDGDKGTAKFMLAGKEHAETMTAIITEWEKAVKNAKLDAKGQLGTGKDGSAYIEFSKQSDSLKFKLAELKNMKDKLLVSLGESDGAMSGILDSLISGLKMLGNLAQNPAIINLLKLIAGVMVVHAGKNGMKRLWDTISTGTKGSIRNVLEVGSAWKNVKRNVDDATIAVGRFNVAERASVANSPNAGTTGGSVYRGANGKPLKDRQGNTISDPNDPRYMPMVDVRGNTIRDREGRHVYNPNDHDTRRYRDSNGSELLDRQGRPIVNPSASRPSTPNVGGAESAVKGVGKALGKTLSLIPLLGDGLILLEIMGVPVFDKIGEGLGKMFKSTKDNLEETENLIKKFKGANDLINGSVDATRNRVGSLQSELKEQGIVKKDKNGNLIAGDKDYIENEDEYAKFKKDFNAQAEGMDLKDKNGVAIRIEMNDTSHILEAMKAMNVEKAKLEQTANLEVGKQISQDISGDKNGKGGLAEKETDVAKAKLDHEQALKNVESAKNALKSLKDANGNIVNPEAYLQWKNQLDSAKKKVESTEKSVGNATKAFEAQKNAIGSNARALMSEGKNFDATKLKKSEAIDVTKAMIVEYKKMRTETNGLSKTQKALADGTGLTDKQYKSLIKRFPEYANAGKQKVETDKEIRAELGKKIQKEQESMDKTIESAESAITSAGKEAGMYDIVKQAIDSKTGATKLSDEAVKNLTKSAEKIPAEKTMWVKIKQTGKDILDSVTGFWNKHFGTKEVTVAVNKKDGGKSSNSVQVGTTRTTGSGRSSASIATGTSVRGAGSIVSQSKASGKKKEANNSRVSEDVWRYWSTEDKQAKLESAMRDLERAVTDAKDDYAKVIKTLTSEIRNLESQKSTQGTLKSKKDSEINSVLNKLKGYGFKVNTKDNSISNLGHAKNLKGAKAEKADALLSTWHSLTGELISINDKIKDINGQIKATKDQIKEQKIAKELKSFEVSLKRVTALMTSVSNADSLYGTKLSLMGGQDKELSLKTNEQALASSKTNMSSLMNEFNKLALKKVEFKENGEQIKSTLDSLGQQILAQADNIIKYRQAINDIEFARITEDLQKFNTALDRQGNKVANNIENLKEGLLSGTSLKDLASSKNTILDLSRDNKYEKDAQDRINLEKEVQEALEAYAKKNVDREKGVANSKLDINKKMYNQLLTMQTNYTSGKKVDSKKITATYGELDDIAMLDEKYAKVAKALEKYYKDVQKKQTDLTNKYNNNMANAKDQKEKQSLTDQFILDSLDIEKLYYEAQIKANNSAIKDLNGQLKDASEDDKVKIKEQIALYEQSNMDTQNKIKDTIKARFDFEFSLMNEAISKTNEAKNALQDTLDILSSLGEGNYSGKGTLLEAMLSTERERNAQIKKSIADLRKQQGLYEEGSYEWKIINEQISQYNSQLTDSNKQLIDMNKNILANSFTATTTELEKKLFNGKSHDAWQQHQQLWMEGLEKEIALEKMYKRMADLGTTVNKDKLDLLAEQEKLSKFEMDRLNKQLDIIELQEKVDNLSKQKTIQVLKQNEFGQWDWTYEADATQLDKAKDELSQAQLALKQMEEKAREDYLQQLNKILSDAQSGNYDSVEDFRKAMEELGKAFDSAVGDIPEIGDDYINDLVEAYTKFISDNAGVVADNPANAYLVQATQSMTDTLKKTFTDISASLGQVFANALLAKLPNTSVNASKAITSGSTAISIDKLEFPNATNKEEIQEAILSLPQLALQKSKSKV